MTGLGLPERATQTRVLALLRDELGYRTLGDWTDRADNSNIEEGLLTTWLTKTGCAPAAISRAIHLLRTEAKNPNRSLYDNNKAVYGLLRYGVPVKIEAGKATETVQLINWAQPAANDFAIAEEVTLRGWLGGHERRPDLVLYINGIAVGVIELKNSRTSIGDGIRQNLSNQQPAFSAWFFSANQFVFAGNDSEGLRYGTIGTPEKYFLKWKEDESDDTRLKLDKYLLKMCSKARLLELMYDYVLFDGGVKKLPRVHQYVGIKMAQARVAERKGGVIWHTQGSGKSIVMVMLAKWIPENRPHARVVVVTDRDELDKQIETVFREAGVEIKRTSSGQDLMRQLSQATPRLLCSLVHKFGRKGVDDFDAFIRELAAQPSRALINTWAPRRGVTVERCFVQQMKTRWGSCNTRAGTIRLNTELAKKPRGCLEYIVAPEMMHLLEPTHNARFVSLMDRVMPDWPHRKGVLNRLPVRHERWGY